MSTGLRAGTNNDGYLQVNGTDVLTALSSGRIGIGTTGPARKVEIVDTAATVLQLNSTSTDGTSLRILHSGNDKMYMGLAGDFIIGQANNVTDSAIRSNGALMFAAGGGTERLRILSDGTIDFKDNAIVNVGSISLDFIKGDADDNTNITFAGNDTITFKAGDTSPALTINTTQVKIEDNQKFVAGTGNDLQIYHDSATGDSFISETGTGNLKLTTSSFRLRNAADSEHIIWANEDAEVRLYHDSVKRFETTSSGVEVTGTLDLAAISDSISDTAVDVFVYDTSKDSDGGAWRKRTQHTSWYNETLNTSTRGSRREFPSIAVIVVQNAPTNTDPMITIYDGDDPDLPMWMVFRNNISGGGNDQRTSRIYYAAGPYQSVGVVMKNGILVDGQERSSGHLNGIVKGITKHDFVADTSLQITDEGMFKRLGNLGNERNVVKGYNKVQARSALPYTQINALAITVLPNAPINPKTGMKVPTVAVATESGVVILRYEPSDGYPRIYDFYNAAGTHDHTTAIDFNEEGQMIYSWDDGTAGSRRVQITPILAIDDNTTLGTSHPDYSTATMGFGGYNDSGNYDGYLIGRYVKHIAAMKGRTFAAGDVKASTDPGGISIVDAAPQFGRVTGGQKNSLIAHISSSYNTGWMQGDIRFAGLADTDATNRNAETENLITGQNHDYDTNTGENWTSQTNATATYSSTQGVGGGGAISLTSSGGSSVYSSIQFSGLTANTKYVLYFLAKTTDASRNTSFNISAAIHNGGTNFAAVNQPFVTANAYHPIEISFKTDASTTSVYFSVYAQQGGSGTLYMDEFYIVPAELDHIQDGAGIAVYGSINKTAVATGSELVAYSNFGASNWLVQPYGSGDLNFGTGNFSISGWFNMSNISNTGFIVDRASAITSGGGSRFAVYTESSQLKFYTFDNSANSEISTSLFTGMNTEWVHFVCNRMSSGQMEIYLDGVIKTRTNMVVRDVGNSVLSRCVIGHRFNAHPTSGSGAGDSNAFDGSLALIKISGSCPTAEEVSKMYRDERRFYAENAKVTLYGTSDAVSGLAYDSTTNLLHVGTSAGRSDFEGLCRINNKTTAVTTAISASNGLIAEQ